MRSACSGIPKGFWSKARGWREAERSGAERLPRVGGVPPVLYAESVVLTRGRHPFGVERRPIQGMEKRVVRRLPGVGLRHAARDFGQPRASLHNPFGIAGQRPPDGSSVKRRGIHRSRRRPWPDVMFLLERRSFLVVLFINTLTYIVVDFLLGSRYADAVKEAQQCRESAHTTLY